MFRSMARNSAHYSGVARQTDWTNIREFMGSGLQRLFWKRYYIEFWKVIKNLRPEGFVKDASVKGTLYTFYEGLLVVVLNE